MTEPDHDRAAKRIGRFVVGVAAWLTTLVVTSMIGAGDATELANFEGLVGGAIMLALVVLGVGIVRGHRLARGAGVVLFGLCAIAAPISAFRHALVIARYAPESLVVFIGASFAASSLMAWLSIRAVLVLLGRARARWLTPRIAGAGLALTALVHLWSAGSMGAAAFDSGAWYSMSISQDGIVLMGFPLWPVWHAFLAIVAVALAVAPRRHLAGTTSALVGLFALLVVLTAWMTARSGSPDPSVISIPVLLAAMAWWLRIELRDAGFSFVGEP